MDEKTYVVRMPLQRAKETRTTAAIGWGVGPGKALLLSFSLSPVTVIDVDTSEIITA